MTDDFDVDLTDIEPERIDNRANKFPVGQFHVQVNSFTAWGGKNHDQTIVQLQCLASNIDSAVGLQHDEYFNDSVISRKVLLQIAIACRLTSRDEIKKMKEQTGRAKLNWDALVGRQCLIATTENEDKTNPQKKYVNIDAIFDVDEERAKHIPKNETFANRFRSAFPRKDNGKPANGHAAAAAATQPAKAEGSFNDADLGLN